MLPVVAPLIIVFFFPFYRRLDVTTSYEYVLMRFGPAARYAVSLLFVLARLGWLGTVIYAPALALSAVTGFPMWVSIVVMGGMGTLYTVLGGIEAVIWTDVVQFVVMVGGVVWVAIELVREVPGGVSGIMQTAARSGHLNLLDWWPSLAEMTVGVVMVSYLCQFMHDYGVDQVTVQRLLATKDLRALARATVLNSVITVAVMSLLAFIGLGLCAYYAARPAGLPAELAQNPDRLLPHFMVTALPGVAGSIIVSGFFAAAMSSLDSGINSLSTVIANDFIGPVTRRSFSERAGLALARGLTLALGALATSLAFIASRIEDIMKASQTFLGLFSGPVLALFLLGVLTRRGTFAGWCVGTAVAVPLTFWVQRECTYVNFIYYFPLCFVTSLVIGYVVSLPLHRTAPPGLTLRDLRRVSAADGE